jgi:hypothetical protein
MDRMAELLETARAALAEALEIPFTSLADGALLDAVEASEAVGRLADAARVVVAAEVDARSVFELGELRLSKRLGHANGAHLLERLTRASASEVARRSVLGRALRPRVTLAGFAGDAERPVIAEAVTRGEIGIDAAAAIHRALTQAERARPMPEAVAAAEAELVASARENPADYVRDEARVWREYLDPDGVAPREEIIHEQRSVTLGRERNGITPIAGRLDQKAAALLKAAFAESLSPDAVPRFLDETDAASACERVPDPRTREQRQHDVFVGLLTAGLRSTGNAPGELRPLATVMATITVAELAGGRGLGWLDDVEEPVSTATIEAMVCDSGLRISVLDDNGCPLDEGRRIRLFTAAQRRALAVRDGGCVWPGCTAPPGWCEAHHVIPWSRGGPTDIGNGSSSKYDHLSVCSRLVSGDTLHAEPDSKRSEVWTGFSMGSEPWLSV